MGNVARPPSDFAGPSESDDENEPLVRLGDRLGGRFGDITIDSVEAVRRIRESE